MHADKTQDDWWLPHAIEYFGLDHCKTDAVETLNLHCSFHVTHHQQQSIPYKHYNERAEASPPMQQCADAAAKFAASQCHTVNPVN